MCISITIKFQLCEKLLIPIQVSINWYYVFQLLIAIIVIGIPLPLCITFIMICVSIWSSGLPVTSS